MIGLQMLSSSFNGSTTTATGYAVLQLDRRSDDTDLIKKQYRRLALLLHPDRTNAPLLTPRSASSPIPGRFYSICKGNPSTTISSACVEWSISSSRGATGIGGRKVDGETWRW
ncbi:hypothetical protein RHGRI_036252 [Rhododendron griersonianum]|uniref:J domain-containing protein n=1 Tax=Rhododendron griersonianum TaxID=479676 RepID=A0AAV6HQS6_9ERIC|nr:hypothetical protein RHGRI_036252 [Rhododendron griersonianum]